MVVIKSISLEPELIKQVEQVADAQQRSFSQTVSRLLQMALGVPDAIHTTYAKYNGKDRETSTPNPQG